jgi:hypothetical protein
MSAATYSWNNSANGDPGNWFTDKTPQVNTGMFRKTRYIDCTQTTAASAVAYKVMNIPAGTFVSRVQVIGTTGENLVMDIGDTGSNYAFLSANQSTAAVQTVWSTGKYYASADEIQMTFANAASNFKGFIVADMGPMLTTSD